MPSNITAADHLGAVPATTYLGPDDGDQRTAAWIRALAALVLANDDDLYTKVADITPDLLAANNTWTGTNTYSSTVTLNGPTTANGAFVAAGAFSATSTFTLTNAITFAVARSYTRSTRGTIYFNDSEWTSGTNAMWFIQATAPGSGGTRFPVSWVLDVPPGSTITGITWYVAPAGGHGALPGQLPELLVRELNPANGTSANVVSMTDTSASVVAYEAPHTVSSGVLSYATTEGRTVIATMYGEKGPNEVSGGNFYPPVVTFTRTTNVEA